MAVSLDLNVNSQQQPIKALAQGEKILTDFSNRIANNDLDMVAYHQLNPLMMMGDEEGCAIIFTARTQLSKTHKFDYNQLAQAYYEKCFPNLHPLFCYIQKHETIDNVLEHSRSLLRLSSVGEKQDTLLIPTFSPLGCVGVFTLNIEKAQVKLTSQIDTTGLMSQILMQAQACHVEICHAQAEQNAKAVKLTARERQILHWVVKGKSNGVIAEILGLSLHTVTGYLRTIYLKTKTNDRTSAAIFAIQQGILHVKPVQAVSNNVTRLRIAV